MKERELPEGWELVRLDEIALEFISGGTPSTKNNSFWVGSIPWTRSAHISSKYLDSGERFINQDAIENSATNIVPKNNVLIATRVSVGKTAVNLIDVAISQDLTGIVIDSNKLLPIFLVYYLSSPSVQSKFIQFSRGSTIKGIQRSDLRDILIPIPPLSTQRKIVAILEQAEHLRRLRAEADALTQQLVQSVFLEMFGDPVTNPMGWDVMRLEKLASRIIDCPHSTPNYAEGITPFPCVRTTDLKNGYLDWSQMKYVDESAFKERIKRLTPREGDIVYGREGTFGVAIRIPKDVDLCLGQRVMLFRPETKLCTSEFLWALINSSALYHQALKKTSGSTVGHVNVKDVANFVGFCPPLSLQLRFGSIVRTIEGLLNIQNNSTATVSALGNALMSKAFTGDLIT